ncbi:MAG: glycosyltransferase [Flavobacteriia bacterium]|nr:glycosyltransferase [Flavobacteriia bacterium]
MENKKLHIVSFDIPFPANYGGIVDVYYRIISLHSMGVKIHLHCFEYGRKEALELEKYCEKVTYYKRKRTLIDFFSFLPFIVKTRINKDLEQNLLKNNDPILFEGIHTSWYLNNSKIQERKTIVRAHNIEHDYYNGLAKSSKGLKKIFFLAEAMKLRRYEHQLTKASIVLCVKQSEIAYYKKINQNTFLLNSSFEQKKIDNEPTEKYILFHGNLSVSENEYAVIWLIENVFKTIQSIPIIIAGKDPSLKLKSLITQENIKLIESPDFETMKKIVKNARIHILYSDQNSGLKLKLLAALQTSGIVLVNSNMVQGTDLEKFCIIAEKGQEFVSQIINNIEIGLSDDSKKARQLIFETKWNVNQFNSELYKLI